MQLQWGPGTGTRVVFHRAEGDRPVVLSFGDGTSIVWSTQRAAHTYPAPGVYTARAVRPDGAPVAEARIAVRAAPDLAIGPSPDDPYRVVAEYGLTEPARIILDYGDGQPSTAGWALPGGQDSRLLPPGTYTATLADADARRTTTRDYTVVDPPADPDFTLRADPDDASRHRAVLEFTAVQWHRPVSIDWGDGATDTLSYPQVGALVGHTFDPDHSPSGDGVFFVIAAYVDGGGEPTVRPVTIPIPEEGP